MSVLSSESLQAELAQDYFALFGLAQDYALERDELDGLFRELQARVHPDKFAHAGDVERRQAMQLSTRVNEAYQTLRHPLKRAQYLLQLRGVDPALHSNTAMPAAFLIEQMELREAVDEARVAADAYVLEELHKTMRKTIHDEFLALSAELGGAGNVSAAADRVRRLMFQEKLLEDIDNALESL